MVDLLFVVSLVTSVAGFIIAVVALLQTTKQTTASIFSPATTPSQEGEQNRQLQGLNIHLGELRGDLRVLQSQVSTLKEDLTANEEANQRSRDRVHKLEKILREFAHGQRKPWCALESEILRLGDQDKDDDVYEEDEEEEKEEICSGCSKPMEDCDCDEDEEEEEEDEEDDDD